MPTSMPVAAGLFAGLALLGASAQAAPAPAAQVATLAPTAGLGDIVVLVQGVRWAQGRVRVELCTADVFLTSDCTPSLSAPAQVGETAVRFADVPPGVYAFQAYHDRNGDGHVNRGPLGIPVEDLGFSREAPLGLSGPKFARAAVRHGAEDQTVIVRLRHFWAPPGTPATSN